VTPESGTGLVHCAPAYGAEDYHVFRNLNLLSDPNSIICHVDGEGRFTDQVTDVLGQDLASGVRGKEVLGDGSKAIIDVLKRLGRLIKNLPVEHRYPYDWKTDKPIIVTYVRELEFVLFCTYPTSATSQWFANLDDIKQEASNSLHDVQFWPSQCMSILSRCLASHINLEISTQSSHIFCPLSF